MTLDQLITQTAQMMALGATTEEIHTNLQEFIKSESDIYLIYTAGKLHSKTISDSYRFARLAGLK